MKETELKHHPPELGHSGPRVILPSKPASRPKNGKTENAVRSGK